MELSKSNEVLAKEAQIADLQKQIKKRTTTLKSLRTRLTNTEEEVRQAGQTFAREGMRIMEKLQNIKEDLEQLLDKGIKQKKMPKKVKEALKAVKEEIFGALNEQLPGDSPEEIFQNMQREAMEEEAQRKDQEPELEDWELEAQREEVVDQRKIRKVYLSLSVRFHPDKAKDKKEADTFHDLMLRINKAYKENDVHTLLEIERQYATEDALAEGNNVSFDRLDEVTEKLERELEFIENQVERTSKQIKDLRNSPPGEMLTAKKRAEKEGVELGEMLFGEFEEQLEVFEEIQAAVEKTIKKRRLHPVLEEFLEPDPFEEFFKQLMGADQFDQEEEDETEDYGTFATGDPVVLRSVFKIETEKEAYDLENPTGKVLETVGINEDGKVMCLVAWDKATLARVPEYFQEEMFKEMQFDGRVTLLEEDLAPLDAPSPTTLDEDLKYPRKLFLKYAKWKERPELYSVVEAVFFHPKSNGDEKRDWERFFATQVELPVTVKRRYSTGSKHLETFEYPVLEIYWDEERNKFRALTQGPKRKMRLDLMTLYLTKPPENFDWLETFHLWELTSYGLFDFKF